MRERITYLTVILATIFVIWAIDVRGEIKNDCSDPYHHRNLVFGYWIDIEVGSTKEGCKYEPKD